MGPFENPVEIENCKHKFCFECFHLYLVNLINHNNIDKIPCPKNSCPNKELSESFFCQYLSSYDYSKYLKFKKQNIIARDPKKIFCPHCDSYAQIQGEIYESSNPNYKKTTLKCMNNHEFCSCGRPLHEKDCYKEEKEFQEYLKKEKIKKCPKCGFLIKKKSGCNHMICGNKACKFEFCWLCLKESLPGHYESGPCLGKQFINPDSIFYQLENKYQNSDKLIQKEKSKSFLRRFIIHLIINIIAFTYIFLLINKTFPKGSYKDLIYILICLIVELFFTVQRPLYKAFMRILTCNKIEKFKEINKVTEDEEYDNENNNEES